MTSHLFEWNHPATEVYVTGTFDDWSKSVKLELHNGLFSKRVQLPPTDKHIFYKERDAADNLNNVLVPTLSVNPLPASDGPGNPIELAPGQPVPAPATALDSNVTLDKASYDNAGSNSPDLSRPSAFLGGVFGVPPVGRGVIPESSLPMGRPSSTAAENVTPFIQSAGADSSTAALAAQVPKTRSPIPDAVQQSINDINSASVVPDTVKQSVTQADAAPEALTNPTAVEEKAAVEAQLKREQPKTEAMGEPASTIAASQAATAPVKQTSPRMEPKTPVDPPSAKKVDSSKTLDKKAKRSSVFFSKIKDKFRQS